MTQSVYRIPRTIQLLHPDAKLPYRKHDSDAGFDCYLIEDLTLQPYALSRFPLGIACQINPGEVLSVRTRSSTKMKGISSPVTTCDPGYTGQLFGFLINHNPYPCVFKKGERVVQIVFTLCAPVSELVAGSLDSLNSSRGQSGFGSSGRF